MGKKQTRLTGLSFFAKEMLKDSSTGSGDATGATSNTQTPEAIVGEGPSTSRGQAGQVRKACQIACNEDEDEDERPNKKRKVGLLGPAHERYDATGLVPYYTDASQVPEKLRKYFYQRERYFSLYSQGCLLDEEGWFSVTPELIADQIAERCRCDVILDAFCGVGGNAIAFAKTCERVIALDTSPVRLALARHNAVIYGVEDRIEFILADYISFARSYLSLPNSQQIRKIDVVFLSPPWGGPEYLDGSGEKSGPATDESEHTDEAEQHPEYSLSSIRPIHGAELFNLTRKITPNVAYFLPRNTNLDEISGLLRQDTVNGRTNGKAEQDSTEMVEVEEEWMGSKLKALTCYFDGLVSGQEHLWDS
ncbi:S-adenosyl-L-methionine-dependent methyltransferase [Panus rudis PR-1116 ss-1]|nr:S-adenosyl-L-methionine-dependent methyltransferase [Panus rudis PR-1116 ss-1]